MQKKSLRKINFLKNFKEDEKSAIFFISAANWDES